MSHREFCWWPPTERYYLDFATHSFPTKEGVTLKIIFKNINRLHWRFHVALVEPVGKMFNYVQWIRSLDNHRRQTVTTGGENALKAGASLACLEIRYEMRRRFYTEQDWLPKRFYTSYLIDGREFFRIFTFYIVFDDLFLNWFNTRVSDDRKYICDRRLYACIVTRKFKGNNCYITVICTVI